jgi:alpha-tubulin suppressor-like RCC1 family protein
VSAGEEALRQTLRDAGLAAKEDAFLTVSQPSIRLVADTGVDGFSPPISVAPAGELSVLPTSVRGGLVAIAAGQFHCLALMRSGSVTAWGFNDYGQLGDGTRISRDVPVEVVGLTAVTAVAVGTFDSFALRRDGSVATWGMQTGPRPMTVPILASGVTAIDGALALREDGTAVHCLSQQVVHVPVRAVAISAHGSTHFLALMEDGGVMAWGGNDHGQLGTGSTERREDNPAPFSVSRGRSQESSPPVTTASPFARTVWCSHGA